VKELKKMGGLNGHIDPRGSKRSKHWYVGKIKENGILYFRKKKIAHERTGLRQKRGERNTAGGGSKRKKKSNTNGGHFDASLGVRPCFDALKKT